MAVFGLFFIVVSALFNIYQHSLFPKLLPDMYHRALAQAETAVCESALLPHLEFLCASLDATPLITAPAPQRMAVVSLTPVVDFSYSEHTNGTYSNQPSAKRDPRPSSTMGLILHPRFASTTFPPSPVSSSSSSSSSSWNLTSAFTVIMNLLALFGALGPAVLVFVSLYRDPEAFGVAVLEGLTLLLCGSPRPRYHLEDCEPSPPCHAVEEDSCDIEVLMDAITGTGEYLACNETELLPRLPSSPVPILESLNEPCATVAETEPESPEIPTVAEPAFDSPSALLVAEPTFESTVVLPAAEPALESPAVVASTEPVLEVVPTKDEQVDVVAPIPEPASESPQVLKDVIAAESTPKKKPARSGRRLKKLKKLREQALAEAAATEEQKAAATSTLPPPIELAQPELEASPEAPSIIPCVTQPEGEPAKRPHGPRGGRRVRRKKERLAREQALAAATENAEAGPSATALEARGPATPMFTEDDFPPLPVDGVALKALSNKMSYALVTAVGPPSAAAVVHVHPDPWVVMASTAQEPAMHKWNAAGRCYEDCGPVSRWAGCYWTMDLEEFARIRVVSGRTAKTKKKKKKKTDG